MTQAERTRAMKYVLAKSSRWLLHRRMNTKTINIPWNLKIFEKYLNFAFYVIIVFVLHINSSLQCVVTKTAVALGRSGKP